VRRAEAADGFGSCLIPPRFRLLPYSTTFFTDAAGAINSPSSDTPPDKVADERGIIVHPSARKRLGYSKKPVNGIQFRMETPAK